MKPHSQIRRDARWRNIPSTRGPTRIATWNVHVMSEQGRCANISKEITEYNIDILGCARQGGYKQDRRGWAQERLSSIIRTWGQQCITHSMSCRNDVGKRYKVAYRMGAGECKANGCQVQNISWKDNTHSDHVLRSNKWCRGGRDGGVLW